MHPKIGDSTSYFPKTNIQKREYEIQLQKELKRNVIKSVVPHIQTVSTKLPLDHVTFAAMSAMS